MELSGLSKLASFTYSLVGMAGRPSEWSRVWGCFFLGLARATLCGSWSPGESVLRDHCTHAYPGSAGVTLAKAPLGKGSLQASTSTRLTLNLQ